MQIQKITMSHAQLCKAVQVYLNEHELKEPIVVVNAVVNGHSFGDSEIIFNLTTPDEAP